MLPPAPRAGWAVKPSDMPHAGRLVGGNTIHALPPNGRPRPSYIDILNTTILDIHNYLAQPRDEALLGRALRSEFPPWVGRRQGCGG